MRANTTDDEIRRALGMTRVIDVAGPHPAIVKSDVEIMAKLEKLANMANMAKMQLAR
jgi:hypothetical protein